MKVIILCGGKGLRMQGILKDIPKPLVQVQGKPLIWHIMDWYSKFGHHEFILPLGYGGEKIKEYFMDYIWKEHDFNLDLKNNRYQLLEEPRQWNIKFIDTGIETMTGTRLKKLEKHMQDEMFLLTYGDGLAKININELIKFHKDKGKIATLTGIKKVVNMVFYRLKTGLLWILRKNPYLML